MIRRSSSIGTWLLASASLAAQADEIRLPVEAPLPQPSASAETDDGPSLLPPTDPGPNSGGPGSPADELGAPAPAAAPAGTEGSGIPEVIAGVGGIWAPEVRPGERPIRVLPALAGGDDSLLTESPAAKPAPDKPAKEATPKDETPAVADTEPSDPSGSSPTPPARVPRTLPDTNSVAKALDPLDAQVDEAIEVTARRVLTAETNVRGQRPHTPWQIGHGMLAYRTDFVVKVNGEKVDAYDWVATNPVFYSQKPAREGARGGSEMRWFYLTPHGARPQKYNGVMYEFEGHPNQFLAFFALARIPLDFEFTIQGKTVTFGEMLHNAKMEINDREEVTWNLWAFAYYFDMNETWRNARGEAWSMERVVSTTIRQLSRPRGAPCGGCHALFALASARNSYLQSGNRLSGVWMQSHMLLEKHIALAKSMQNEDGSFSGLYFKGPKYWEDPSKRISTTGHTLEFLMLALQQDRLQEPWVRRAVAAVARDLVQYQQEPLEVGGMYHAVHALVLYRERTRMEFATAPSEVRPVAAEAETDSSTN